MECLIDPSCDQGGPKLWHSVDGDTWSNIPTPIDERAGRLRAMAQSGATIVAVGSNGLVLTSQDGGLSWTEQAIPMFNGGLLEYVAYGDGHFLVCLAEQCARSADGVIWKPPFPTTHPNPDMPVVYSTLDGFFVGVDDQAVYHASGDVFWSAPPLPHTYQAPSTFSVWPHALIHDGARFVMIGGMLADLGGGVGPTSYPSIAVSSTVHEPWEVSPIPEGEGSTLHTIAHSPESGRYVAVGSEGLILYSDDLSSFQVPLTSGGTPVSAEFSGGFDAVVYGAERWVAVGDTGQTYLSTDDGLTWQAATVTPGSSPGEDPTMANLKAMIYRP
jgi:hypothetical protein